MSKAEVIVPYFALEPDFHLNRSLTNLYFIKDSLLELIEIDDKNELFNMVSTVFAKWTSSFAQIYHSVVTFHYQQTDNEMRFDFSTNLPEIVNEIYLTTTLKMGEIKDYNNVKLFSVSHDDMVFKFCDTLYNDSFNYFTFPISWMVRFIIGRSSIEIKRELNDKGVFFQYYLPKDKATIEIKFDLDKLDLVRDRWYHFLVNEQQFTIKGE